MTTKRRPTTQLTKDNYDDPDPEAQQSSLAGGFQVASRDALQQRKIINVTGKLNGSGASSEDGGGASDGTPRPGPAKSILPNADGNPRPNPLSGFSFKMDTGTFNFGKPSMAGSAMASSGVPFAFSSVKPPPKATVPIVSSGGLISTNKESPFMPNSLSNVSSGVSGDKMERGAEMLRGVTTPNRGGNSIDSSVSRGLLSSSKLNSLLARLAKLRKHRRDLNAGFVAHINATHSTHGDASIEFDPILIYYLNKSREISSQERSVLDELASNTVERTDRPPNNQLDGGNHLEGNNQMDMSMFNSNQSPQKSNPANVTSLMNFTRAPMDFGSPAAEKSPNPTNLRSTASNKLGSAEDILKNSLANNNTTSPGRNTTMFGATMSSGSAQSSMQSPISGMSGNTTTINFGVPMASSTGNITSGFFSTAGPTTGCTATNNTSTFPMSFGAQSSGGSVKFGSIDNDNTTSTLGSSTFKSSFSTSNTVPVFGSGSLDTAGNKSVASLANSTATGGSSFFGANSTLTGNATMNNTTLTGGLFGGIGTNNPVSSGTNAGDVNNGEVKAENEEFCEENAPPTIPAINEPEREPNAFYTSRVQVFLKPNGKTEFIKCGINWLNLTNLDDGKVGLVCRSAVNRRVNLNIRMDGVPSIKQQPAKDGKAANTVIFLVPAINPAPVGYTPAGNDPPLPGGSVIIRTRPDEFEDVFGRLQDARQQ